MTEQSRLAELAALVDNYVEAYNAFDYDALAKLTDPNIHLVHRNRGVEIKDAEAMLASFRQFGELLPDRGYTDRRALDLIDDDTVVVRHAWAGTASTDIPGFGSQGERVGFDLASFMTFRDGRIVAWEDYG